MRDGGKENKEGSEEEMKKEIRGREEQKKRRQ